MFYNKNTAANILAFHTLSALENAYMVYDSSVADCFTLIYKNGKKIQFQDHGDVLWKLHTPQKHSFAEYLHTARDNNKLLTKQEIEKASYAVEVLEYLRWPSIEEFIRIIRGNEALN